MRILISLLQLVSTALALASCNNAESVQSPSPDAELSKLAAYIRDSAATIDSLDVVFYFPVNAKPELRSARPLKSDDQILFCCAGAFTLLENDRIDGLFIENGRTLVRTVNHNLGGGITITPEGETRIFGTEMGKVLDSSFVDSLERNSISFLQQIQMIRDGQPLVFRKDQSLFQRRAICQFQGKTVIIETKTACTLQKFAEIIKKCGIFNALYVDMGSWDEGWYRTVNNTISTIGLMRNSTKRQSNWVVFVKT